LYQQGGAKLYHWTARCEYQSPVVCKSLGLVGLPALLEAEAIPVHLQDMDMVGKRSRRAPVSRSEPKISVHSSKGRLEVARTEPRS